MSDFEDRLRGELVDAAAPLGPTPGLRGEVDRRVRHHRRVRRAQVAVGVMGAVLVILGVGVFLESDDQGNEPQTFANIAEAGGGEGSSGPGGLEVPLDRCDLEAGFNPDDMNLMSVPEGSTSATEDLYVGLDELVALAQAGEDGRVARVVCRDGVPTGGALDYAPGLVDLYVVGGEVVAVRVEQGGGNPFDG